MSNPTPGPWNIGEYHKHCVFDKNGYVIADCLASAPSCSTVLAENNACLIAAAPELLEALTGIIEIGKRDMRNPKYDGYFEFSKEVIAKAKAEATK